MLPEKVDRELDAANRLLDAGLYEQVIVHSYFAAFYAARAAITATGALPPRTHSGTTSAFGRLIVTQEGPRGAGRAMNVLEEMRQQSAYQMVPATREEAADSIRLAHEVIEAAVGLEGQASQET